MEKMMHLLMMVAAEIGTMIMMMKMKIMEIIEGQGQIEYIQ